MNFKLPQQQQRPEKQHRASDAASQLMKRYGGRAAITASNRQATVDQIREQKVSNEYLREMPRRWQVGDVYSPHDLSPVEMNKWRRRSQRKGDVIDALGIRPLDTYKVRNENKTLRNGNHVIWLG
jgi:small subunit ribosomal protein S18